MVSAPEAGDRLGMMRRREQAECLRADRKKRCISVVSGLWEFEHVTIESALRWQIANNEDHPLEALDA